MLNFKKLLENLVNEEVSDNFKQLSLDYEFKFLTRNDFKSVGSVFDYWEKSVGSGEDEIKIRVYPPDPEKQEPSWAVYFMKNNDLVEEGFDDNLSTAILNLKKNLISKIDFGFSKH